MPEIAALPSADALRLRSVELLTDLAAVVRELVENSIVGHPPLRPPAGQARAGWGRAKGGQWLEAAHTHSLLTINASNHQQVTGMG